MRIPPRQWLDYDSVALAGRVKVAGFWNWTRIESMKSSWGSLRAAKRFAIECNLSLPGNLASPKRAWGRVLFENRGRSRIGNEQS
jgi:hypothetical protein